ncbi:dihydroneopterin aldolase [Mucilaginibacter sp. Bleaf8]|nr:dihydroneopterin aldolase [Mucilaginibacter sp. Bleaf8]
MIQVSLIGADFFARHGYYPEEQILGNRFLVDIDAQFAPFANLGDDQINNTLNYEQLNLIAEEEMKHPRQLLETVAQNIADQIMQQFPYVLHLKVSVKKVNPPLKGMVAATAVTILINQDNKS